MLELKKLSFCVGKQQILNGVSLKVQPGELVVVTGPNGSGKSTLASCIMGIHQISDGQILFDGTNISKQSITDRAKTGIAFSFQQPCYFKGLTVKDLLHISATGQETFIEDNKTDYGKLLQTVGLGPEYLEREINDSLSGGELKRVEIASALARRAKLLIFDEPEAGIDIWSFEKLTKVFKNLKKSGVTMIIISHQRRIMELADRIVILEKGKLKKEGPAKELLIEIEEAAK